MVRVAFATGDPCPLQSYQHGACIYRNGDRCTLDPAPAIRLAEVERGQWEPECDGHELPQPAVCPECGGSGCAYQIHEPGLFEEIACPVCRGEGEVIVA